jgi:hypothetical protein
MEFNSVIHVRAESDRSAGGPTPQAALAKIEQQMKDPMPLTKCGRMDVARSQSENPPPGSYERLREEVDLHRSTLCPRCLYVENHPLLRMAVRDLAIAQAQAGLRHIAFPGVATALCGSSTSGPTARDLDDGDPFHVCLECAAEDWQRSTRRPSDRPPE